MEPGTKVQYSNAEMDGKRFVYVTDMLADFKARYGDRLLETRNLFGEVTLIDPHSHSSCGDGHGSVTQNYEAAMACGLDCIFYHRPYFDRSQ